jgi:anti-anti-sigma factor
MNINVKKEKDYTLLTILDIRIDSSISEDYKNKLVEYLTDNPLIVDFGKLEFIDSSGLSAFVFFYKQAVSKNITVRFINISDKVMSILKMTGLTRVFEIYSDLNEAIEDMT